MTFLYIGWAGLASCDREGCRHNVAEDLAVKQDCPPGLARCVAGSVEIAEGHPTCNGCPCAWRRVAQCEQGCAVENVTLVREPPQAATLCKRSRSDVAAPAPDAASTTCAEGERFLCRAGVVHACPGASSVPVGVCSFGCAVEDETLDDPSVDVAGALSVLCAEGSHDP